MDPLTWIIVGLVAGVLASLLVGGSGYGIVGDIIVGIVGAFIGGWIFQQAHWRAPFAGLPGTITVALLGAIVLLVGLHAVQRARGARRT